MKSSMGITLATLVVAIAGALLSPPAGAVEATQADAALQGKTRAQVKAELQEAIRTGDLVAGPSGQKLYELAPARFAPRPAPAVKTRDEVKAELAEAMRSGDIVAGEAGARVKRPASW